MGARLVVLGEAPGRDEEALGAPFVGASGRFLWEALEKVGVRRQDVRVENVLEVRPEGNDLWTIPPHQMARAQASCWERLAQLEGAQLIVPVGNLALNTLRRAPLPLVRTGKRAGRWKLTKTPQGVAIAWRDKIGNWRGSITRARFEGGAWCKVIPTYHPAFILRAADAWDVWKADLKRISEDRTFPQLRRWPRATHLVDPTPRDCQDFLAEAREHELLACDIETRPAPGRARIRCVGFALSPRQSIILDPRRHWKWIVQLLRLPIAKAWCFGLYDRYTLAMSGGVAPRNNVMDVQSLHHLLDPRDQHRLAYMASRELRVAYWKDEAKEEGGTSGSQKDEFTLRRYCGKDVVNTYALVGTVGGRVSEAGLMDVYRDHYQLVADACFQLSTRGFLVDERERRRLAEADDAALASLRAQLTAVMGADPVREKGLSSPAIAAYFYDQLKCKPFYRRGTGGRTCDELALRRLSHRYKKAREGAKLVLSYRAAKKAREAVEAEAVDGDGRMRSLYTPTAKTGRLRAAKTPLGTGAPMQNRMRGSRRNMFVASPGMVLVEVDESQAEDRIVNGMSGDPQLLAVAQERPGDPGVRDRHLVNASHIFEVPYEALAAAYEQGNPEAQEKRQLGKKTRHMLNYDGEGLRMSEVVLVESEGQLVLDPEECQEWIDRLREREPGVASYHRWVREQMQLTGELTNSWGRTLKFTGLRLGKEDYKEGYAFFPQSEVACLMNQWGFRPLSERPLLGGVVQQGHDSLVVECWPPDAWLVARRLARSLSQERGYPGAGGMWTLEMPVSVKLGRAWGSMREWKGCPEKQEFEDELRRVMDGARGGRRAGGAAPGRARAARARAGGA